MKTSVLIVFVLSSLLGAITLEAAPTPKKPKHFHEASKADRDRISKHLADGNTHDARVIEIEKSLDDINTALQTRRLPPRKIEELRATIAELVDEHETRARQRNEAWNEAIHLSITARGMVPPQKDKWPKGTMYLRFSPFDTGTYEWKVAAGDNVGRTAYDAKGQPVWFGKSVDPETKKEPMAITGPDGGTVLFRKCFANPDILALSIAHELKHFDLNTTAKHRDKTRAQKEIEVLEFEEKIAKGMVRWTKQELQDYLAEITVVKAKKQEKVANEKLRLERGEALTAEDYRDEMTRAPGLSVKTDRFREDAAAIRRSVEQEFMQRHFEALRAFARRECARRPPSNAEIGDIEFLLDRSQYFKELGRFVEDESVMGDCFSERFSSYLSELYGTGRLAPIVAPTAEDHSEPVKTPTAPRVDLDPFVPTAPKPRVPVDGERDLLSLVSAACQKPWEFKNMSFGDLSWFPVPGFPLRPEGKSELTECEKALWSFVLELNDKGSNLDLDGLALRASGYQYRPPTRPNVPYNHCIDKGNNCIPLSGR